MPLRLFCTGLFPRPVCARWRWFFACVLSRGLPAAASGPRRPGCRACCLLIAGRVSRASLHAGDFPRNFFNYCFPLSARQFHEGYSEHRLRRCARRRQGGGEAPQGPCHGPSRRAPARLPARAPRHEDGHADQDACRRMVQVLQGALHAPHHLLARQEHDHGRH